MQAFHDGRRDRILIQSNHRTADGFHEVQVFYMGTYVGTKKTQLHRLVEVVHGLQYVFIEGHHNNVFERNRVGVGDSVEDTLTYTAIVPFDIYIHCGRCRTHT